MPDTTDITISIENLIQPSQDWYVTVRDAATRKGPALYAIGPFDTRDEAIAARDEVVRMFATFRRLH